MVAHASHDNHLSVIVSLYIFVLFLSSSFAALCTPRECKTHVHFPSTEKGNITIKLGLQIDENTDETIISSARWLVYNINKNHHFLLGVNLELNEIRQQYTSAETVASGWELAKGENKVIFSVSDTRDEFAPINAEILSSHNVVNLNVRSTSAELVNKSTCPYLLRGKPSIDLESRTIALLLKDMNFTQVAYCHSGLTNSGIYSLRTFERHAAAFNISVIGVDINSEYISFPKSLGEVRAIIYSAESHFSPFVARIYVDGLRIVGASYLYIFTSAAYQTAWKYLTDSSIANGAFALKKLEDTNSQYFTTVTNAWANANSTMFPRKSSVPDWSVYDAINAFAVALDGLVKIGVDPRTITPVQLTRAMSNLQIESMSGIYAFDSSQDRLGTFAIENFVRRQEPHLVGTINWQPLINLPLEKQKISYTDYNPVFYGGSTINPAKVVRIWEICNAKICNYNFVNCTETGKCICNSNHTGEFCENVITTKPHNDDTELTLVAIITPLVTIVVISVIAGYMRFSRIRKQRRNIIAARQSSRIARGEFKLVDGIGRGVTGEVYRGIFRGMEVAIKKIIIENARGTADDFRNEAAFVCTLQHPNIVSFYGACLDEKNKSLFLVMQYMQRGSLYNVLHSVMSMPFSLKIHIAIQAAQGLCYLHEYEPILFHCDFKSHNILIDEEWNAKVSDCQTPKFMELANSSDEEVMVGAVFWTAPEVLKDPNTFSERSDCYSFGVVLWEIFHRDDPYSKDIMAVAMDVMEKGLRPNIHYNCPDPIKKLIEECWAQDPRDRPSMRQVLTRLVALADIEELRKDITTKLSRIDAPTSHVYLVRTEMLNVFALWDSSPRLFQQALLMHNDHMRRNIAAFQGYEVKFELSNCGFTAAFSTIQDSVNFCISSQMSLMRLPWSDELLANSMCEVVTSDTGELVWRGPRVRMSISSGYPNCEIDPMTGRMSYSGSMPERSQRMLAMKPEGSIVAGLSVISEIEDNIKTFLERLEIEEGEWSEIGGPRAASTIKQIIPFSLRSRTLVNTFPVDLPNVMVGFVDEEQPVSHSSFSKSNSVSPFSSYVPSFISSSSSSRISNTSYSSIPSNSTSLSSVSFNSSSNLPQPTNFISSSSFSSSNSFIPSWLVTIDNLIIISLLEKGVNGDFYLAKLNQRDAVIKILVTQNLKENEMIRFLSDAIVLAKTHHPNLTQLLGVCLDPDIGLVFEYMKQGNLTRVLGNINNSTNFSFLQRLSIALDISTGMEFLSTHPDPDVRIHTSFKSKNVLLSDSWEVKITDYGQASLKDFTRTMTTIYGATWTAPEILDGSAEISPKASVYAFGFVLYELYTRKVPFEGEHPVKVVAKILSGYRPTISECPSAYSQLMERCWSSNVDSRPQWGEVATILREIFDSFKNQNFS